MAIRKSLAEGLIDLIARSTAGGLSFLQIGANDGVSGDFIRMRALSGAWHGVCVEPSELYMDSCRRHYSDAKRIFFERAAVSKVPGELSLYRVRDVPPDRGWSIGIASLDVTHLHRLGFREDNIIVEAVPVVTGQSLVQKYGLYNLDLLVVDVEGHELNVLRSFDYSLFFPKLIVFETTHCSEEDIAEIASLVGDRYDFIYDNEDAVLLRSS